ncbi:MAG: cell division protein ZapE [Marinagarivorans sp.]|nr:cell division protein ZapE [Marinagarivorans sp.]
MPSPLQRYQQDLLQPDFMADASQALAIAKLQDLFERLCSQSRPLNLAVRMQRAWSIWVKKPQLPVKGLYFWGGVGRGKTYLMDIFFETLPFEQKMRTHFHRFMRRVHQELNELKGEKNPLIKVAERLSREARVICFDEFFVTDITDAMILAGLLTALFERGVTLVATSNIVPTGLYQNGLQRARFLPAIALLQQHTEVVNIDGGIDYRLRALQQAALYYSPLTPEADAQLVECFLRLAPDAQAIVSDVALTVEGRTIMARKVADDVAWFDFYALCDGPRSQRDYIELAREYHAVVVSNVPLLGQGNDDQARRFIYMVDEFYDRGVKLVISAAEPIVALYSPEGRLRFEFERTQSRLLEMQSEDYLALAHKA